MRRGAVALLGLLVSLPPSVGAADDAAIAKTWFPDVVWRAGPIHADFDCDGKDDFAMFGLSADRVIVAVFPAGEPKRPRTVAGPSGDFDAARLRLEPEALDVTDQGFEQMIGAVPPGYQRSSRCQGLVLSDEMSDPFHIYWNHERDDLSVWRV